MSGFLCFLLGLVKIGGVCGYAVSSSLLLLQHPTPAPFGRDLFNTTCLLFLVVDRRVQIPG